MKLDKIIIRNLTIDDLDNVGEIEAKSYGQHHWSKDSFRSELNNDLAHYYCALDENAKLLGYIGTWFILDEAHITTLAILPEYRHLGIATHLMIKFIDECYKNKIKYITLEVRVSNTNALNLYKKFGFNSLGVRAKYYQDNDEDAAIMWTENIFYKKYKLLYNQIKNTVKKLDVIYE